MAAKTEWTRKRDLYGRGEQAPRFTRTHSFKQLQAQWYGKLKSEGFRDIETGRDTNTEKAYRNGERVSRLIHFEPGEKGVDVEAMMAANADTFGTYTNVADTPTAVAWRNIAKAAHLLPTNYKRRAFLIDLSQVGCYAAYLLRRHRISKNDARWTFRRFLEDAGLDRYQGILVCGPVRE